MNMSCDISWFVERDIDLWLCEGLRVNRNFAGWFFERTNGPSNASCPRG